MLVRGKNCREILVIIISILLIGMIFYLQCGRDIDVSNSFSEISADFYEENITVIVNRLSVANKEKCAEEIIKKCRENDFQSVLFSYDKVKPNALYGTVYLSRYSMRWKKPLFTFSYIQKSGTSGQYNIVDNPDVFYLEVQ